ncbi:terminus macrodomain insulation protein YfbV [Psychromonas hadalis]|uniref:terminus macrodomain insulation protein YfbV n=1 Tax=Psychromonas hadalis TaxID=211669 RepID=UPI0003B64837|nr:terminus macrodomain insulation protein YfbV [Psychromonas hadalis]
MNLFFDVVRQGDLYLKNWPKQKTLNCLFVDSKVAFYTRLSIKVIPAFIMLIISLNMFFPAMLDWPATATLVLFLMGLPVQGLYWLGKRSATFLPNQLLPWYAAIEKTLNNQSTKERVMAQRPRYLDLALLLKNAFKRGGDNFLQNNELI